jgi:hypothetical protein
MNSTCPKLHKLILFALIGLLITICFPKQFFSSDRQVLAQTTNNQKMTTQIAKIFNAVSQVIAASNRSN